MTPHPPRERKLMEQPLHPLQVLRYLGINFSITPFEVRMGDYTRSSMPWAGDEESVQGEFFYETVEVQVSE